MNKIGKILSILPITLSVVFSSACAPDLFIKCEHEFNDGTVTTVATCISDGVLTKECKLCGEKVTESIPALGHDLKETITTQATCSHTGLKTTECKREDCDYHHEEVLPKTAHDLYFESQNSTNHIEKCHGCDYSVIKEHRFDDGVVTSQSTHTVSGSAKYTCLDCGFVKNQALPKLEFHSWGPWYYKNEEKHARVCACGSEDSQNHLWNSGVITTQPTHLTFGVRTYTCSVCSGTKTEQIAKLADHSYGNWQPNGRETHIKTCGCGDSITEAHSFGEGVFTPITEGAQSGTMTYTCSVCGYSYSDTISGYKLINNYVFKNKTGTEVVADLYDFAPGDLETPVFNTQFTCNAYHDFADVDLSKFDEVFFYYKQTSDVYPALKDASKNIIYYDMGSKISGSDWNLFRFVYNSTNNSWSIVSPFVNVNGLEISDLSDFKFQTGGSTPVMYLSPLFGHISSSHSLNEHTLQDSGYELIESMPLNFEGKSLTSYETTKLLAKDFATKSNYFDANAQTADIRFKSFDEDKYDEIVFYFRSLKNNDGNCKWTEIGKVSETTYNVYASNSESWNEIKLVRNNSNKFDVYANGTYKCEVESTIDLRAKVLEKQLISGIYGKVSTSRILLVSNKTTNYSVVYNTNDARFGKHSAELLAKTLNSAVGSSIFTVSATNTKPAKNEYKICVGTEMAKLAGLSYENVRGLNYKFTSLDNSIYIFGDTNFGTNNGVKHFLKNTVNYEYYYKGVETYNTDVSKIIFNKEDFVSNTSFLVGYDVNAETRSDAGYTWNQDFSYSIDTGLVGDGAAGDYGIYGGWHNEAKIAEEKGITLYQTSIRNNPQKHMNLTLDSNAQKVAEYLNTKYYSQGKDDAMFCLMDDFSWYNKTDAASTYSPTYYAFINKIAEKLESIVTRKIYLVAVAYHQTVVCPTNWVPHNGNKVGVKVYLSPSNLVFSSAPNSKFNDKTIKMQDDIADNPTVQYNPYQNVMAWKTLSNTYSLPMFVYMYDSLPNYFAPLLTTQYMLQYYKLFKSMGVERVYDMGQYDNANATDWTRLKTYLKGKLTDNCDITEEEFNQLIVNFFNAYYGAAGTYMKQAFDLEFSTITNPVSPGENDYDNYYGKKNDRKFPFYLRGYYYNKKSGFPSKYQTVTFFENSSKTGIMDYYDKALNAVSGNKTLEDRVKLDGLALRYWYWGCNTPESDNNIYGGGLSFGYKNARQETFEQIIADAKKLGVTQWGEGAQFTIDNPVKG